MHGRWDELYSMQDWTLSQLMRSGHGFHLTGGTALSRGYYDHRYSEDLDLFANDAGEFGLWRDRCIHLLQEAVAGQGWRLEIVLRKGSQ